ncbi:hypothetical protein [Scleromatobacter humisilvae]|uniref:DUF4136 domain-containing protein n=1 Tax=Scleromatobacter humisilvae TaxID=2897159 RepID=A0A9X1YFI3_9BURK|nr:hypothetical protein [Scleromatobacter humisilvae]MCK9684732.1 hypothetical protein [Scleromatobacter humisilvae]
MKKLLLATSAAIAVAALQGCVTARTSGQVLVADAPADNHLHIVIVPGKQVLDDQHRAALRSGDKHMATLFPQLASRLPEDLRANGVEASATLLDAGDPMPPPTGQRTLVIRPTQVGEIYSGNGSWLDLDVSLTDPKRGTLWHGAIHLSSGTPGVSYDASAVDHAAVPLMEQLRDAKLIDISWRRPVTP